MATLTTLNVGIVGAGIAGLAAAIALRRSGHKITVYERSRFNNEVGAAINMPPQATKILESWNISLPEPGAEASDNVEHDGHGTILQRTRRVHFKTAQTSSEEAWGHIAEQFGSPFVSYHRGDLHSALKAKAVQLGAAIRLGSQVRAIDCLKGEAHVSNLRSEVADEVFRHDLLVIADGINCPFIADIVGHDVPLQKTGRCCFRTLIPTSKLLADSLARTVFEGEDKSLCGHDGLSGSMNPKTGVYLIAYPCRDGELMNVAVFDRPIADRVEKEDWNTPAEINDALEPIADFHDAWKAVVKCADTMKAFTINLRDPLPRYVNGKTVIIGDAAHPMLPTLAGGGSTSLEDAAALGVLFSDLPNTENSTVSSRLALFNALRLPRDATQQILSTAMFKPQPAVALREYVYPYYTGELPSTMLGGWNKAACDFLCSYDVFHETEKAKAWAEDRNWTDIDKVPEGLVQHFGVVE